VKRSEKAVAHWRQELAKFPSKALPSLRRTPESLRYMEHTMRSKAVAVAAIALSKEHRASVDSVILAFSAELLGRLSGNRRCGFLMFTHNRFEEGAENYSGTLVQNFPICVELDADTPGELIKRTHRAALLSALSSHGNPDDIVTVMPHGFAGIIPAADTSCAVNLFFPDLGTGSSDSGGKPAATRDEARRLMLETRFSLGIGLSGDDMNFYLSGIGDSDDFIVSLRADTAILSSEEIVQYLRDLERIMVESLTDSVS
jgi:hypothetical protein